MSEANENITNQPDEGPRTDAISNEQPPPAYVYEPGQFAPPLLKSKTWLYVLLDFCIPAVLVCFAVLMVIGLMIPFISKVSDTSARAQSINNAKQMILAVNIIAENTTTGNIPPAYGSFPIGSSTSQSFFVSLLPFIEQNQLYTNYASNSTTPVKTYVAPCDPYNPGTNGLISYGSNATALTVGGQPTLPASFGGRTSGVIVVFERTAKSGATWSGSNNYLFDQNGSSSPEFSGANSWSSFRTRATALDSAGCVVGMADGSARAVTKSNAAAGWAWAMNPSINGNQPAGW